MIMNMQPDTNPDQTKHTTNKNRTLLLEHLPVIENYYKLAGISTAVLESGNYFGLYCYTGPENSLCGGCGLF